jgi:hypothetical protein
LETLARAKESGIMPVRDKNDKIISKSKKMMFSLL